VVALVRIPPILRPDAGGNRQVEIDGPTVRAVLENLANSYPPLRARIFAGDELQPFLNVFLDGSDVRLAEGLETPVGDGATLILLPAVAGGAGRRSGRTALRATAPLPGRAGRS
jgi:sulfur-carrier protein